MEIEKVFIAGILEDLGNNRLSLPSLPEVALRIRKIVENPRATAAQVAKAINLEAALSARLLKVVNSPLYRGQQQINDVQGAITRLGRNLVRTLVTSLLLQQVYGSKTTQVLSPWLKTLWNHSTKVAALSYVIARRYTKLSPDEAMLAGLIHDIGVLPVLMRATQYPELLKNKQLLDEIIRRLHKLVGPMILQTWGFSPEFVDVAGRHEDIYLKHGDEISYLDIIIVANLHSYLGTQHPLAKADWNIVPAFEKLGLTPEQSIASMEEAREEQNEVMKLLTL